MANHAILLRPSLKTREEDYFREVDPTQVKMLPDVVGAWTIPAYFLALCRSVTSFSARWMPSF
jgi:hypothetical protein